MKVISDWEWEVRRAHEEGHVPCSECGHDITPGAGEHNLDGCHAFDGFLDREDEGPCPCPKRYTDHDQAVIWRNYQMPPYVLGLRVFWQGDPEDAGVVVGFGRNDMSVDVRWKDGVSKVDDPVENLSTVPG